DAVARRPLRGRGHGQSLRRRIHLMPADVAVTFRAMLFCPTAEPDEGHADAVMRYRSAEREAVRRIMRGQFQPSQIAPRLDRQQPSDIANQSSEHLLITSRNR